MRKESGTEISVSYESPLLFYLVEGEVGHLTGGATASLQKNAICLHSSNWLTTFTGFPVSAASTPATKPATVFAPSRTSINGFVSD